MKRAPRHYELYQRGVHLPRRSYRFRHTAVRKALELLMDLPVGTPIEVVVRKSGRVSWGGKRTSPTRLSITGV